MSEHSMDRTASRLARIGDDRPGTAYLLVVDGDSSSIFHLPQSGAVVIGRGAEVELRVHHASVSRLHATIRIEDGVLRVADLGSYNGTRVNGEQISGSHTLASGDVVTAGEVVVVLHFFTPAVIARPAYPEAAWLRRLVEELERAVAFKRSLGVVAIVGASPATIAAAVRVVDIIGA